MNSENYAWFTEATDQQLKEVEESAESALLHALDRISADALRGKQLLEQLKALQQEKQRRKYVTGYTTLEKIGMNPDVKAYVTNDEFVALTKQGQEDAKNT